MVCTVYDIYTCILGNVQCTLYTVHCPVYMYICRNGNPLLVMLNITEITLAVYTGDKITSHGIITLAMPYKYKLLPGYSM